MALGAKTGRVRHLTAFGCLVYTLPLAVAVEFNHMTGLGCPFRACTGLDCPGCGATRAIAGLVHGRVITALHYNALVVTLALPLLIWAACDVSGRRLPGRLCISTSARSRAVVMVLLAITWTVFRNLPAFHWFNTTWTDA